MPEVKASGGQVDYYVVPILHPRRSTQAPYNAECEDIISALGMTFDEGCEFKAVWRTAAARKGTPKPGHDPVYDAEKRVHYSTQSLKTERHKKSDSLPETAVQVTPSDHDGWIKWDGGNCPVIGHVIAKLRSGMITPPYEAKRFDWVHSQLPGDIIAYKRI